MCSALLNKTTDFTSSSVATSSETLINEGLPSLESIDPILIERGHARRMGHLENYFALLQRQKLYTNFTMYYELNTPLRIDTLASALRKVIFDHPILATTIVPKGYPNHIEFYESDQYLNEPYPNHDFIAILDELKLTDVLLNEQKEYKDIVDRIRDKYVANNGEITSDLSVLVNSIILPVYQKNTLNWRLLILDDYESNDSHTFKKFVYISNHCNSDAMTSYNLISEILKHVNDGTQDSTSKNFTQNKDTLIFNYMQDVHKFGKIAPPITDIIDYKPSLISIPQFIISTMIKKYLNFKSPPSVITKRLYDHGQLQLDLECDSDSRGNINFHHWLNLTTDQLNNLREVVRSKNCSLTGFLQTILFFTLKENGVFNNRSWNQLGLDISIPNDTRKLLPLHENENFKFGSNVGGLHYSFGISYLQRNNFWSLCQYYTKVIQNGDYLIGLGSIMLDSIVQKINIDKLISESYLGNRRGGIILSNIGMLDDPKSKGVNDSKREGREVAIDEKVAENESLESDYTIEDVKFMQDVGDLNFSLCVNCCSTTAGGIQIGLSTVGGSMWETASEFDTFCKNLRHKILAVSEKGETPSFVW